MAKRPNKHPRPVFKAKSKKPSLGFLVAVSLAVVLVAATVLNLSFGGSKSGGARNPTADGGRETNARQLDYEVANSYPHDPAAFLQGLLWYQGGFYESTGLNGQSTLRRFEFPSGKFLKSINLPAELFGEGLALAGNRLVQLEWKSKRGFVYDRDSFALLREFRYDSEGWGITYDGKYLIMSDGSSKLTYLDANSFAAVRTLGVTMNGRPIDRLTRVSSTPCPRLPGLSRACASSAATTLRIISGSAASRWSWAACTFRCCRRKRCNIVTPWWQGRRKVSGPRY